MEVALASDNNAFLQKLRRGELVAAMMIRASRTPDIARVASSAGYQSVIVDLEHSTMSLDEAATITSIAADLGLFPFVRVPERDYGSIGRCLDGGAWGIIAARIETLAEAKDVARACRFAPRGQRSQSAMVPQFGLLPTPAATLNPALDGTVVVQLLIETPLGVSNAAEIAKADGVDMLAIGANDLSAELGRPGDFQNPRLHECIERVAAACEENRKLCAVGGISDLSLLRQFLALGVAPLIIAGSDIEMLWREAKQRSDALKEWHSELHTEKA